MDENVIVSDYNGMDCRVLKWKFKVFIYKFDFF